MNWWKRFWRRAQMEELLDKEVQFHIEKHAADLMARGIDPEDARREARLAIGGPEQVKEDCRDARGTRWLEEFLRDLRHAARVLVQSPGFASISVLTLALGIGATTAIFSVVNPILFEPLPYVHADRIATIWYGGADGSRAPQSFGGYRELATNGIDKPVLNTFRMLGMMRGERVKLTSSSGAAPEAVLHPRAEKIEGVDGMAAMSDRE